MLYILSEGVHEGVDHDEDEGNDEIEDEPGVDHLDIGGCGETLTDLGLLGIKYFNPPLLSSLTYRDKQGDHDQHGCQIDSDHL